MRKFLSLVLCVVLTGLPALAQSGTETQQPTSASQQNPASTNATGSQTPQGSTGPQQETIYQAPQQGGTQAAPAGVPTQDEPVLLKRSPQQDQPPVLTRRQPPPSTIPMARTVPVNTQFKATLDRTLSSKISHPGDTFTVTLTEPLRNQQGDELVPAGTRINGVVQDAESGKIFASMRGKGKLSLRFQEVQLPSGQTLPIQATLLGVNEIKGKGKVSTNDEGEVTGGTTGTTTAKDIGIGAGVGTIAGLIFGGALKGLAIGAIAGGGYVLANAGKDVELPAQTGLNLRLDQLLTVPR